jgi:hypothetical protein
MSEPTQIHPDKVRAYLATDYRLGHTNQDIVLTIGQHSPRLAALCAGNAVTCGAFLTAYNPQGTIQSDAANAQGHAEFASKLQELGLQAIEGSGSEEGTEWPAEKSYFALGLALDDVEAALCHLVLQVDDDGVDASGGHERGSARRACRRPRAGPAPRP